MPPSLPEKPTPRTRAHTNSFSGSVRYPRDSAPVHPTSSESISRPSSIQRPDFHFLDFTFQSFIVPSRLEGPSRCPSSQPRLPRLSQPLFEKKALDKTPIFPPSFSHPNSPYVPLASPVRREYFRPLTPESCVSHFSGFSRSGAIAPEPWEHEEYHQYSATLMKMSNNIRKIRRIVRRKLSKVAQQFSALNHSTTLVQNRSSSQQSGSYAVHLSLSDAVLSPSPIRVMSNASFNTTHTNSLAQWLNARHHASMNHEEECDMTLEEYERIGSWINFNSGHGDFSCGIAGCQFHPNYSPGVLYDDTTSDDSSNILESSDTTNPPESPPLVLT